MSLGESVAADPQSTPRRYASPRRLLRWSTPHLAVLKMVAWVVRKHERANTEQLWIRCHDLFPSIVEVVLGDVGITFDDVYEHTLAKHDIAITRTRLMQRADKAERYCELNEFAEAVERAYLVQTRPA